MKQFNFNSSFKEKVRKKLLNNINFLHISTQRVVAAGNNKVQCPRSALDHKRSHGNHI